MATQEIIIDCTGKGAKISVNGVKGTSCKDLTKPLEAMLGTVSKEVETDEIHEVPLKQREQQQQRSSL